MSGDAATGCKDIDLPNSFPCKDDERITPEKADTQGDTKPHDEKITPENADTRGEAKPDDEKITPKNADTQGEAKPDDEKITPENADTQGEAKPDDEKITPENADTQGEAKPDDESTNGYLENGVNEENKASSFTDDKPSKCDNVGNIKGTLKTANKVDYTNSVAILEIETTPQADPGNDIDDTIDSQSPERTVTTLDTSGEIENLIYARGDFESECGSSGTEEDIEMGAFVCTKSKTEDAFAEEHEESRKKMPKANKDTKNYKQQKLSFFGSKDRSKESNRYRAEPYSKRGERHSLRIEEKNENTAPLRKRFSDRDTQEYRNGYPGKEDNLCLNDNLRFYRGEIISTPNGAYIDDIHQNWWGDMERLERHHGYIQWLFPIRESGMNSKAQTLQLHEAEAIKSDPTTRKRVLRSYKLMLDFYGMKLQNEQTGALERSENWKKCFANLKRSPHNYLRITRILKCLGELGLEHLKKGLIQFVLEEALDRHTLAQTLTSCRDYWIGTIKDDQDRGDLYRYIEEHDSS